MSNGEGKLGKVGGREGKKKRACRLTDTLVSERETVPRFAVDEEAVAVTERESKALVGLGCHRCAPVHGCSGAYRYNMLQRV
jgi:hypothetical protein